jgi:hypothetical protein
VTLSRGKKSMASNTCGNIINWVPITFENWDFLV